MLKRVGSKNFPFNLVAMSTSSTTVKCVTLINVRHCGKNYIACTAEGQKDTLTILTFVTMAQSVACIQGTNSLTNADSEYTNYKAYKVEIMHEIFSYCL